MPDRNFRLPDARADTDSLGLLQVPPGVLCGGATLRGQANFDISLHTLGGEPELLRALARTEHAAVANREQSLTNLMQSSAPATAFVPTLNYAQVSKLPQASVATSRSFIELAIERGPLTGDEVLIVLRESADCREEIA